MKSHVLVFTIVVSAFMWISAGYTQQTAEQLFQSGIYKEEVQGELDAAIKIFETIIKDYPDSRSVAAKALLHTGLCYEKLGKQEAQKAYQRLVNNYPDQKQEVAVASERLSRLKQLTAQAKKAEKAPLIPKFTKINIPTELSWSVALSPDGEDLALVSDKKLWVMPLSGNLGPNISGTPVQLNTEGLEVEWSGLSWSRDGNWIAFNENPRKDKQGKLIENQGIYLVPSHGGKPKKAIENYRDSRVVNYRISLSPDGKNLAFSSAANNQQHIFTMPVERGNPKQLTEAQAREPVFSPDGKMIAYVEDKNLGREEGDLGLWVIPSQGGTPHKVADAGKASSPVWSPDGSMIAYLDYTQNKQIFIVPIDKTGQAKGNSVAIDAPDGTEEIRLLAGWTPENKIGALLKTEQEFALYTLPAQGGQAAMVLHDTHALQPRWSRDGKQIYYITPPKEGINRFYHLSLATVSANGGAGKPIPVLSDKLPLNQIAFQAGNRVSPDGKMIVSAAWTTADTSAEIDFPKLKIWKIATDGSKATQITHKQGPYADGSPCWSPDGKKIAFVRVQLKKGMKIYGDAAIYVIDSSGGEPDLLVSQTGKWVNSLIWSPNGNMLAWLSQEQEDPENKPKVLNVYDFSNKSTRILGNVPTQDVNIETAWSPDSKRIAFNDDEGKVIKVTNLNNGNIEDIKTGLVDVSIYHLDWSPDGKKFVFGGIKGGNKEFWFMENFLPLEKLKQHKVTEETSKVLTNKKIWNEPDTELDGAPSPDGKYLSYVDWNTGDLAVFEIATGKKRRLTNKGLWKESDQYALMSRWSPDSKQIVYEWYNGNGYCDIRIIGLDGLKPRILYSNKDVNWTHPYDWSPDGKQILAYFERNDQTGWTNQIMLISVADGSVRILKSFNRSWPENMCFSPNGRYILYDWPQKADSPERDIFMITSDGNHEMPLVEHPAYDELFGWPRDGKNILFGSDRNGTFSLWSKQIVEGNPVGNAKLIKADIGAVEPMGFTRNGSFFYGNSKKSINMYSMELDPESGEILAQPEKIITRFEGYNQTPEYSPDGKYLAFVSKRFPLTIFPDYTIGKLGGNVLCVKSLETGEEREFFPDLEKFIHPRWSPDGLSVIVMEWDKSGANKIDIQTGNVSRVLFDDNIGPQPTEWSHDGKMMYYVLHERNTKSSRIIARNTENGKEKEIYRINGSIHIRLSPDGKWLAIQEYYTANTLVLDKIPSLIIMPSSGGEPKMLHKFESGIDIKAGAPFTWFPDGKYILYAMKSPEKEIKKWDLYRISPKGGTPEKLGLEMSGFLLNLSVHPNGRRIAFSVTEQSNAEIWVIENLKQEIERIYSQNE